MRLITKTTLLFILVSLIVFGVGGRISYSMIKKEVQNETDYFLSEHLRMLITAIEEGKSIEALENEKTAICKLNDENVVEQENQFKDTIAMHLILDRPEPHRKLETVRLINGEYYRISMFDVLIESDDMLDAVIGITLRLFLVLSVVFILFSFLISKILLTPFQKTLDGIRSFTIKSKNDIKLSKTNTSEFAQLNKFVSRMTKKAQNDYKALKEFSENASHEIQTPIAIAQGKLELLLSSENLQPSQLNLITDAQQALNRLSKLGKALSLITKIENQEFDLPEPIDFSSIASKTIEEYAELALLKGIFIKSKLKENVMLSLDPGLAEIMFGNLVKNALQHNIRDGWIEVVLSEEKMIIRNSGNPSALPSQKMFDRFQKGQTGNGSLGLGLAIVKKICDVHHFEIDYKHLKNTHQIDLTFPQKQS